MRGIGESTVHAPFLTAHDLSLDLIAYSLSHSLTGFWGDS